MLGIEYVRPLSNYEITIFQEVKNRVWEVNADMVAARSAAKKTYWLNLVMRGRAGVERLNCLGLPREAVVDFRQAVTSLRDEIFAGYSLLAGGFSISPAGSKAQRLH